MVALRGTFGALLVRESANILGNIDKKVRCVPRIYLDLIEISIRFTLFKEKLVKRLFHKKNNSVFRFYIT